MIRDAELRARAEVVIPGGMWGHMNAQALPPSYPQFFKQASGVVNQRCRWQRIYRFYLRFWANDLGL